MRVVSSDRLDPNTAQTPGMNRQAAITFVRVGAQKLWAGTVHIHANANVLHLAGKPARYAERPAAGAAVRRHFPIVAFRG